MAEKRHGNMFYFGRYNGATPVPAYLKLGSRVGTRTVTLQWEQFPIRYFVTDRGAEGVGAEEFRAAMGRAFATWQGIEAAQKKGDRQAEKEMTVFARRIEKALGGAS